MAFPWARNAAKRAGKRGLIAFSAFFLLFLTVFMYQAYSTSDLESRRTWKANTLRPKQVPSSVESVVSAVKNATLGFEAVLVLSVGPSWRTRGLDAAAKLTGLNFTIPPQTPTTDDVVRAFQQKASGRKDVLTPPFGSAKAWLAHLHLLEHVLSLGLETVLIMEDDVDWDVDLRTKQMELVVDNVRNFTGVRFDDLSTISPYGDGWDVLWLGHCGAEMRRVPSPALGRAPLSVPYFDPLRLNGTRVHWLWDAIGWRGDGWPLPPDDLRLVQDGGAVCSWAYAVSRRSVEKVLARMVQGDDIAFDIGLKHACDKGELACVTVVPGVISSYSPPSDLGYLSSVRVGDGKGVKGDEARFEGVMGTTPDIVYSARCEALFAEQCIPA